jgi:ABC-type siderophore export system fused ATPase/permease subunit
LFDGLILENTFTSIPDILEHLVYMVGYVKWMILRISWDTKSIMPTLHLPILFITGEQDELVPW